MICNRCDNNIDNNDDAAAAAAAAASAAAAAADDDDDGIDVCGFWFYEILVLNSAKRG